MHSAQTGVHLKLMNVLQNVLCWSMQANCLQCPSAPPECEHQGWSPLCTKLSAGKFTGFSVCHPIYDDNTMTHALRRVIFSALNNPEATATFLFLPSWGRPMTIDHYSKLLAAYSHMRCKLGTFSSNNLLYDTLRSWTNKEIPLPQHTWNMQIIAVWNVCAIRCLNNLNPTWLQDLAKNIPEAHWHLTSINNNPIIIDRYADMRSVFCKFAKLPTDTKFLTSSPNNLPINEEASAPNQSHPNLKLKIHNWKSWAYTDGSCSILDGEQVIGGGVYQPSINNIHLVEPNGQCLTNTIGRAELASIAAALIYG